MGLPWSHIVFSRPQPYQEISCYRKVAGNRPCPKYFAYFHSILFDGLAASITQKERSAVSQITAYLDSLPDFQSGGISHVTL